jgi:hypothetical protein
MKLGSVVGGFVYWSPLAAYIEISSQSLTRLLILSLEFASMITSLLSSATNSKIRERIQFKLCFLVSKSLHNLALSYLQQHIIPLADNPSRQRLRSSKSADVFVPRPRTVGGKRTFSVAGPKAWNNLPTFIQGINKINTFKRLLKTHLFSFSYNSH